MNNWIKNSKKDRNRHLDKRYAGVKQAYEKDVQYYISSGNCKIKWQWDITMHRLKWPKYKILTIPNPETGWSNSNSRSLLMWMQNCSYLGGCLALSNKAKHTLNIWSSNHTTLYLPKWTENLHSYKNLHVDVYSSFVYNCQNLDAAKMSFSKWMDKQTVVYPDNGILPSAKNKWANMPWRNLRLLTKWKKSIGKRYRLMIQYMTF